MSAPATLAEPLARRERIALSAIVAFAIALRLAFIFGQRGDVLFDFPVIDEERYVELGRELASGRVEAHPWFQPPGVVYALSFVFRLFGTGLLAPRIVQAILSGSCSAIAFVVARRLFSKRVAFVTAAVLALHGVLVFESYELLPPTWVMASNLAALWALLVAREKRTPASAVIAGAALGVSAIFAPIVLPFAAVGAAWLRQRALVGAFVLGIALPIAPVTYGNWQRGHEIVLVSSNGGINFFIGNNADYDATLALRPGEHWTRLLDEPRRAGAGGTGSSYFYRKGLAFWRDTPVKALSLYAHKLRLYFGDAELPRDTDIYAAREGSRVLAALVTRGPPSMPDGLLVPLALVGAAMCWRDRRRLAIAYGFLATQALVVAAFFVTSRYRMPALPVLAMFAIAGVERMIRAWREQRGMSRAFPIVALCGVAALLALPSREASESYAAELDFYRGLAHARHRRDPNSAIAFFRRAIDRDPNDARFWWELGLALESTKRTDEAIAAWRRAATLDPWDLRPARRAANTLSLRGDLDGAIAMLEASVAAHARDDASYAAEHMTIAMLAARRGDRARAIDELFAARKSDPSFFRAQISAWMRAARGAGVTDDELFAAVGAM